MDMARNGKTRRIAAVLLLLFGFVPALLAGPIKTPHGKKHEYRQEIEALEEQWRQALLTNNIQAIDKLTADDYTAISASGTIENKQQFLDNRKSGHWQIAGMELSDRKIRFYGSTAVVTCLVQITGKNNGVDISGSLRYTRVYSLNASGVWRVVSFEASRVRDPNDRR